MNPHLDMLADFRSAEPTQAVPGIGDLTEHLHERMAAVGDAAFQEFAYLQQVAAETWGPERTSHFAIVLRKWPAAGFVDTGLGLHSSVLERHGA